MMGFGISTLLLGNIISALFENANVGWSKAYILLGIVVAVVLVIAGLVLRKPSADMEFPAPKAKKNIQKEIFETKDFTAKSNA